MGGCGSKPRVLKDGAAEQAPEPAPEKVELVKAGISEAQPEEEEEKTREEPETAVADHEQVVEEIEREEAIDTNPPHQQSQSVVQEIKEVAIHEVAEQVKETHENQGIRDPSQSETITALHKNEPEVVTNELTDDQEVKSEANPKVETDDEMVNNIPAAAKKNVETVELEKKGAGRKIETEEKEKTEKGRKKPRPEDNPIVSFFSSLVGQKR